MTLENAYIWNINTQLVTSVVKQPYSAVCISAEGPILLSGASEQQQ